MVGVVLALSKKEEAVSWRAPKEKVGRKSSHGSVWNRYELCKQRTCVWIVIDSVSYLQSFNLSKANLFPEPQSPHL